MPNNRSKSNRDNGKTRPYKVKKSKKRKIRNINSDNEQTKRVDTKKPNAKKKGKNGKKEKFGDRHPKLAMAIRIGIVIFLLLCVIGAGIVAGIFFGLFGDDFEITKDELKIGVANTVVVDQNGAVVANLSGDEKRKVITIEDMAEYLPKAYVAMEDERFYEHHGVDIKRTLGAILNTLLGDSSYGGSTITQQLVKNITKDDEREGLAGIMRKIKEWAKAYQVERMISKDQILELYLNILYVGGEGNLHGVELGAEYYFNKSAKDLSLAECAYMAGINSSPSSYNPFDESKDNTELIKKQTKVALNKMNELGYINSQEEYDAAIAEVDAGLKYQKGDISTSSSYSYHTEAAIDQVVEQVMEEKGISKQLAENYVYSSGLTIYSTVDTNIQTQMEEEFKKDKYIVTGRDKDKDGNKINEHTQAAMVVIDYKTGNVVGTVGGLGEKTESRGLNRATQSVRQTGSSIKPVAIIAPALQEKVITAATTYMDEETNFGGNYIPKNENGKFSNQPVNIRYFISKSLNIPALKIMRELSPEKSIEYLNKMGITSIKADEDNELSLALGGTKNGATPLEMASAYATIANDGVYITPTFYTKVVDSSGNTVLTPKQEQTRVISEQNAYITKQILEEPVKSGGTATYCAIQGMDVSAKTGTTDENYDRWLCGFTPYYAAATWFGYDRNEEVRARDFPTNPAGQIWDGVMTEIHKNLEKATFTKPSGIVEQTVCKTTGCLATTGCTNTYKEIFSQDNLPEKCAGHGSQTICSETGKVATQYCSQYCAVRTNYYGAVIPKEKLGLWKPTKASSTTGNKINEVCTIHTKPKEEEKPKENNTPAKNTANTSSGNTSKTNTTNTTKPTGNTSTNTGNTQTPPATNTNTN